LPEDGLRRPVMMTDQEIIRSFPRHEEPGVPGFITDFLGTKTSTSFIATLTQQGGVVEDYPIPMNFHATMLEWAGVLRAVLSAATEIVAVELGAGWAPWLTAIARAAQLKGIPRVRLLGVEGSNRHYEQMLEHFAVNGLDPKQHTLLHGVVGTADGVAEFPILPDPAADWGARAITGSAAQRLVRRGYRAFRATGRALVKGSPGRPFATEKVPCFSLPTVLRPFEMVDLLHVDIQGDEFEVLTSALGVLEQKVKRLVIGTHGRAIEQKLIDRLARQSWVLEAQESCLYRQCGSRTELFRDGCQVWRNADASVV